MEARKEEVVKQPILKEVPKEVSHDELKYEVKQCDSTGTVYRLYENGDINILFPFSIDLIKFYYNKLFERS